MRHGILILCLKGRENARGLKRGWRGPHDLKTALPLDLYGPSLRASPPQGLRHRASQPGARQDTVRPNWGRGDAWDRRPPQGSTPNCGDPGGAKGSVTRTSPHSVWGSGRGGYHAEG